MEQINSNQNQLNIDPARQNFAKQNIDGQVKIMEEEKTKGGYFYYYLLVVVVIAAGGWFFWKSRGWESPPKETSKPEMMQNEVVQEGTNMLKGTLRISDNPARGNFMLVSGEGKNNFYISTVRDFSSLVGKEVEVRTENMEKGFKLLDIIAK